MITFFLDIHFSLLPRSFLFVGPIPLFQAMDDTKMITETHTITAHGTIVLEVVHTNMPETVERIISMYEQWLKKEK